MKGTINSNFDVRVYTTEGTLLKSFFNLDRDDTEYIYAYYAVNPSLIVDVKPAETLYDLLVIKENKKR